MMDMLEEFRDIMNSDTEHNIELNLDYTGFTVYLDLSTESDCEGMYVIPIKYDVLEDCIHVPYREFVEKYVLTNEDITEYILRKYLGGLLRGETPRSISGAGGFMPACERRRASSIEEAGKMAAQSFSGRR